MDPNAALWIFGSIAGAFIALLGIVFLAVSFLISRAGRDYELMRRMVTEFQDRMSKEFGAKLLGNDFPEEAAKESVKDLLSGARSGLTFFVGSFFLIAYCLLSMSIVRMGIEFPPVIIWIAIGGAVLLLVMLYFYIKWCLDVTSTLELKWVTREKVYGEIIERYKPVLSHLIPKKGRGKTKRK